MAVLIKIFQISFFVGVGLTLISLVFGNLLDLLHFDTPDIDVDLDGGGGGILFSPLVIVIFLTVFGGIGMILSKSSTISIGILIIIASGLGITISYIIDRFVIRALKKAQNTSAPEEDELIGLAAKVNETILENGFGEITYFIHGNSFVAPAKSVNSIQIKKGCEVSICWIKEHIFYVTPISMPLK